MKRMCAIQSCLMLATALLWLPTLSAQKKWTIDTILETDRIIESMVSPSGDYIFYQLGSTRNGYPPKSSDAYTITIDGKKINLISNKKGLGSHYKWSPDSKWISFLGDDSSKKGLKQIWGISPDGKDIKQFSHSEISILSYSWSPDGKQLLYVTEKPASSEEISYKERWGVVISPEEKIFKREKTVWIIHLEEGKTFKLTENIIHSDPQWSPSNFHISFLGQGEKKNRVIFVYDLKNLIQEENSYDIIDHEVQLYSWSPDGKKIAFVSDGSIWQYKISSKELEQITDEKYPQLSKLEWSRNSNKLVFLSQPPETYNRNVNRRYLETKMYTISLSDKKVKSIANGTDFFLGGMNITWSKDNSEIWFLNGDRMGRNLFSVDVNTGFVKNITSGQNCIYNVSFDDNFNRCVFSSENVNMKPDFYVSKTADWLPKRITDINPWVSDYESGYGEIVTYESEGVEIDALVIKPPHFNPKNKYPLLLILHGGPSWYKLNEWNPDWEQYPIHAYSAEGYVLMFPNVRGSAHYGLEFRKAIKHDLGGVDVRDALNGVNHIINQGYIDENNMGVCGWSYGGYLTPAIITQTDRFKAAQFGAGLPSHEAMYGNLSTVEHILYHNFDSRPWENGMIHLQYSPLYYTHKVKTPTLIQHGDKDPRCPVSGAILFYKALKYYKVPTVLEIYPGMGHSITDSILYKRVLHKNLEWFNKWLKNDTTTSFEHVFPTSGSN